MMQTRVCSYYHPRCRHASTTSTTFLSLPVHLRDRIYREADLIHGVSIRVYDTSSLLDLSNKRDFIRPPYYAVPFCLRASHGVSFFFDYAYDEYSGHTSVTYFNLNMASSAVSEDVARFTLTYNEIVLCCRDYTDLGVLLVWPRSWVDLLRTLTIHLTHTSHYARTHNAVRDCNHRKWPPLVSSFRSTSKYFDSLMKLWNMTTVRLARTASTISNLSLRVVCDVEDIEAAQTVVGLLEKSSLVPSMIRLGGRPHAKLTEIAYQSATRTTSADQPFAFSELPVEIRQYILGFTDLVSPLCRISVDHHGTFSAERDSYSVERPCVREQSEFCSRQHAASPPCNCWEPPTSLFLVGKEMLEDARAVFFASNRFITSIDFRQWEWIRTGNRNAEFSFLSKGFPADALPHVRNLEISFRPTQYEFSGTDAQAYRNWIRAIGRLAPHLKRLSLRLYLKHSRAGSHYIHWSSNSKNWNIQTWFQMQEQIVRPWGKVKGIVSCSVRAMLPGEVEKHTALDTTFEDRLRVHEALLEALAVGRRYGSVENYFRILEEFERNRGESAKAR